MRAYTLTKGHFKDTMWTVEGVEGALFVEDYGLNVRTSPEREEGVLLKPKREGLLKTFLSNKESLVDAEGNEVAEIKLPVARSKPTITVDGVTYKGKVALGIAATGCTFKGPRRKVVLKILPKTGLKSTKIRLEVDDAIPLLVAALVAVKVQRRYYSD